MEYRNCGARSVPRTTEFKAQLKNGGWLIKEIDIGGLKNIFHESEFNRIIQADNHVEFYRYWTRKEAFTKAIGKGIVMPLSTIDTTKEIISEDKDNYYLESYRLNKFFCSITSNKKKCTTNWIEVIF